MADDLVIKALPNSLDEDIVAIQVLDQEEELALEDL
jgi:hypothetical protein